MNCLREGTVNLADPKSKGYYNTLVAIDVVDPITILDGQTLEGHRLVTQLFYVSSSIGGFGYQLLIEEEGVRNNVWQLRSFQGRSVCVSVRFKRNNTQRLVCRSRSIHRNRRSKPGELEDDSSPSINRKYELHSVSRRRPTFLSA